MSTETISQTITSANLKQSEKGSTTFMLTIVFDEDISNNTYLTSNENGLEYTLSSTPSKGDLIITIDNNKLISNIENSSLIGEIGESCYFYTSADKKNPFKSTVQTAGNGED
jgi:hypothetical protein